MCYNGIAREGEDMAYTKFGEFVRVLRVRQHEVMGDMARKLGVKPPFLSAVENGKRNVPPEWVEKLTLLYNLSEAERTELVEAIEASKTQYKLSMNGAGTIQRRAAMQFARSFDNMDDETARKILELLQAQGEKD